MAILNHVLNTRLIPAALLMTASVTLTVPAHALLFQFTDTGGAAPGSLAWNGFQEAGLVWSSILVDPIAVNLNIGFSSLASSTLAQTTSTRQNVSYTNVVNALINDQTTLDDQIAVAHLQAGSDFDFLASNVSGTTYFDNNVSINNRFLSLHTAQMKALGLMANNSLTDGSVTFNSALSFDFDGSDGISTNSFDFVAIAIHEIGHALGFVSGVDTVDYYVGDGPGAGQIASLDGFSIYSVLDLYRFSAQSLTNGEGIQDLAAGDRTQYFSIDGGDTALGYFATGVYNGDGRQASHWKDNLNQGLMDPTFSRGELGQLSPQDLLAMDVIGYDLQLPVMVSEPPVLMLFLSGIFAFVMRNKINLRKKI